MCCWWRTGGDSDQSSSALCATCIYGAREGTRAGNGRMLAAQRKSGYVMHTSFFPFANKSPAMSAIVRISVYVSRMFLDASKLVGAGIRIPSSLSLTTTMDRNGCAFTRNIANGMGWTHHGKFFRAVHPLPGVILAVQLWTRLGFRNVFGQKKSLLRERAVGRLTSLPLKS